MSFIYPRTINITRPQVQSGVGAVAYGGLIETQESQIAQDIPASIQLSKQGKSGAVGLPADGKTTWWRILFHGPLGLVTDRDIITDDLGIRYQVVAPYWNSLGYSLLTERLET
jgi:hypothetical protein